MADAIILLQIIQSFAISLGVGSSTMAILNFFYAIRDGKIEETERNFMGITYIVLRVAMGLILITTLILTTLKISLYGLTAITLPHTAIAFLTAILFLNAFLMTIKLMPSTYGPSVQAGSWYSLGILSACVANSIVPTSLLTITLFYVAILVGMTALVNGVMAWLKSRIPVAPAKQ